MGYLALRRARFGWIFAAVWLIYLNENLTALLGRPAGWRRDLGLVALAGFALLYLALVARVSRIRHAGFAGPDEAGPARTGPARARPDEAGPDRTGPDEAGPKRARAQKPRAAPADEPQPGRAERALLTWAALLALLALAALQVPGAGQHALTCLVYVAAAAMVGLPVRQAVPFAAVLVLAAEVLAWRVPGWEDKGYGLAALLGSAAAWGVRMAAERQRRLQAAQRELAELAVTNERARIAADLHDILGHSLTVVTVKAELAQRLLDVDVEKARAELRDLEALARDALSDVRATALGMRGISLPGEIAAAREALAAAHVAAVLPGAADEVPSRHRELFAWTIREAVTNVVRHARAGRCEVRLTPRSVEIVDDGPGEGPPLPGGQGLRGLRRRAEAVGARLTVGRRDDSPGFRVLVEVP